MNQDIPQKQTEPELGETKDARATFLHLMGEVAKAAAHINLSEEEINMLNSFRKFKASAIKQGAMFKWQTGPEPVQLELIDRTDVNRKAIADIMLKEGAE